MTHRAPSERPNTVTVVAHRIGAFGGMEAQLAALVGGLLDRGNDVIAIGREIDLESRVGLTTVTVPGPRRPFPLAYLWFFLAGTIAVALHRRGPLYTMGAIVLNRADARKVPFCHTAFARSPYRRSRASRDSRAYRVNAWISAALSRLAERAVYRPSRTGRLVAMSVGGAADLDSYFPAMAPAAIIPNSVDTERFAPEPAGGTRRARTRLSLGMPDDALVCAFVGGDWKRKGLDIAIGAAGRAGWRLLVIGEGDVAWARRAAAASGIAGSVVFAGRLGDPERLLRACDALVMPSLYEPWGNAVLEACACGLPVVVAPADGVSDFVDDETSGFIAVADERCVAARLEKLKDAGLRESMGAAGRERALEYTQESVTRACAELLGLAGAADLRLVPVAAVPR